MFRRVLFFSLFLDVLLDPGNKVAKNAIGAAMGFFEKNNGSLVGKLNMVEVERSEAHIIKENGLNYQY